ncbi:MAG: hypothetical protein QXO21_06810 [Candidatus Anstonellales archaeon]
MKRLIKILIYELNTCQGVICLVFRKLLSIFSEKSDQNFYDKVSELKQRYCEHKRISKLSSTKFYCSDCGKIVKLVPQEVSIISELVGILIVGSILYILTRKKD